MKFNLFTWSYDGRKLAKPHVILWKLFWFIPLKISLFITCIFAALVFGLDEASALWEVL